MQSKNMKIRIIDVESLFKIDPSKSSYFQNLFERAQNNIDDDDSCYIECDLNQDASNYQYWKFYFKGKGNFEGRQIGGTLKFRPTHPQDPPRFYFDPVGEDHQSIQHVNIYADHSLCLPLVTVWNSQTDEYDILQAIEQIFHKPNWGHGDAPANPTFFAKNKEEQDKIQQQQAQLLPFFNKE